MATFAEIKSIRLTLDDPPGFIDILSIADVSSLPAIPAPQTVYLVQADGSYMSTEEISGATPLDYARNELLFSDDTIGDIIDNYPNSTLSKLIKLALPKLLTRMRIIKNQSGTEDIEFISLKERYEAYKDLLEEYEEDESAATGTNTGQYLQTSNPTIAGGDI